MSSLVVGNSYSQLYLEQYWPEDPKGAVGWADNAVLMLAYQEAALAILKQRNSRPGKMLDISTGPALTPLLAMLPAISEVQLSDFEKSNREFLKAGRIEYWRNYVPMLTKLFPHPERMVKDILSRLDLLRSQHDPVFVDLFLDDPFSGELSLGGFDIVSMQFVADGITKDIGDYGACLTKVCNMVNGGGMLVMSAVVDSCDWELGGVLKPSPNVSEEQILALLSKNGLKTINLSRSMRFPGLSYSGGWIVLAAVRE